MFLDDFPSYKPPFVADFQLPRLITGGYMEYMEIIGLYSLLNLMVFVCCDLICTGFHL